MYIEYSQINIEKTDFVWNKAKFEGGAIYIIQDPNDLKRNVQFNNVIFRDNKADIGAAYKYLGLIPIIVNNSIVF